MAHSFDIILSENNDVIQLLKQSKFLKNQK